MKYRIGKFALLFFVSVMALILCFGFFFRTDVSAGGTEGLGEVRQVESVLVKKGDTLSSLANTYAKELSQLSEDEYLCQIVELNNLESEYIQAGHYILLPDYRA